MKILILFLRTIVVSMYKTQSPFQRLLLLKTKEIKFSATGKRQMLQVYVTEPINYFLNLITHLIFNYFTKKQGMGSFLAFTHHVPYSALSLCSY